MGQSPFSYPPSPKSEIGWYRFLNPQLLETASSMGWSLLTIFLWPLGISLLNFFPGFSELEVGLACIGQDCRRRLWHLSVLEYLGHRKDPCAVLSNIEVAKQAGVDGKPFFRSSEYMLGLNYSPISTINFLSIKHEKLGLASSQCSTNNFWIDTYA